MVQREIEIILARQLASYLAVPILIVDRDLDLLFFNESAEPILGRRFEETGEVRRGEWSDLFRPSDATGVPLPREEQALALAIDRNEPSHRRTWLTGFDGVARLIEGLAFPLESLDGRLLGAAGVFLEVGETARDAPQPIRVPSGGPRRGHEIEVILLRRLADRLSMPTFAIDAEARLLFYNKAAEPIMGRPFGQVGPIELNEWYDTFKPTDRDGSPIKSEDHPMVVALREDRLSFRRFDFQALDGVKRRIEGTAFPLIGQCGRHLGAVGFFWEEAP